jgi:hypothetical protein
VCVNGTCRCNPGFGGTTCATRLCPNSCFNNGNCTAGGVCVCRPGFRGSDCRFQVLAGGAGNPSTVSTLDYTQLINVSAVPQTELYKRQTDPACPFARPFRCSDGVCAAALGECSLRAHPPVPSQWNASLYLGQNLATGAAVTTSSGSASAALIVDGRDTTAWQGQSCYPIGFVSYNLVNLALGVCAASPSRCTSSSPAALAATTDTNLNTATALGLVSGRAWFRFNLAAPTTLAAVTIKASTGGVTVRGVTTQGTWISFGTFTSAFAVTNFDYTGPETFTAVQVESAAAFSLFELAVRSDSCSEYAVLDLGSVRAVSSVSVRHTSASAGVRETRYEASTDGSTWTSLRSPVSPALPGFLDVSVSTSFRFFRVRHVLFERTSAAASVFEVAIFGPEGRYGPAPPARPNPVSFRDLLGVNGIWAWGGQGWSMLARDGWGPHRYKKMASHARNYHNWNWDVTDPDNIPDFERMACGRGTQGQWWLSWDWEYSGWAAAGLEIDVSVQFISSSFAQSSFTNPYLAGRNYGFAFAKHFGRTGVNLVSTVEVGNEPWGGYDANFYSTLLLGFAQGAKAADPAMRVLPAAFDFGDALARINATHARFLDGLNVHSYSWMQTPLGRTGAPPEHPLSSLNSVNSWMRLRDAVLPGLPVHLTEWGWDSAGGGQTCHAPPERSGQAPFPECVSEQSQALYAVRGALVLARKGLARATWFFYGDLEITPSVWDSTRGVFARSGLVGTQASGFKSKQSLLALEHFVQTLGSATFLSAIQESEQGYVYVLGTSDGTPTHVVAWLPVDGDSSATASLTFNAPANFAAAHAWFLGLATHTAAPLPVVAGAGQAASWTLTVSAVPVAVALTAAPWAAVSCGANGLSHNGTCICRAGFGGPTCSTRTCENNCWQRGVCNDGVCSCFSYWSTAGAGEYQRCNAENLLSSGPCRDSPARFDAGSACFLNQCPSDCNGNGVCTPLGCVCNNGYSGSACELLPCPFNCRSHGTCRNGTCVCDAGFAGPTCEWPSTAATPPATPSVLTQLSTGPVCSTDKPYACQDGSCVVARGACVADVQNVPTYDPTPFLTRSLSAQPAASTTASSQATGSAAVIDGADTTQWQSAQCFPTGYIEYAELNSLAGACAAGRCGLAGRDAATDRNMNNAVTISSVGGAPASFVATLAIPEALVSVTAKISGSSPVVARLQLTDGSIVTVGTLSTNFAVANFMVTLSPGTLASAVSLESAASFNVFELAARSRVCSEHVTVDLGSVQQVGGLTVRHWAGSGSGVAQTVYESSLDGVNFVTLQAGLNPYALGSHDVELSPAAVLRYVRVRHTLQENVAIKVSVFEVSVWGIANRYGPAPTAAFNPVSFRELLGINGIWGWGSNSYSSSLGATRMGPWTFASVGSHARNYHNWNWDVVDPDAPPPFEDMVPRGSTRFGDLPSSTGSRLAQGWLNWDNEYTAWRRSLEVEVSVQFTSDMFPPSVWNSPYDAGLAYGSRFATHFGSATGTGDVSTLEVGNEPFIAGMGFADPVFYREVLLGMARGAKAADPTLRVLPAAFGGLADLLARINATHVGLVDGLNVHAYSWIGTGAGRTGVYPEHNMSTFQDLNSVLRFRDAVLPSLPVYLTEWGWDSAGGGQTCNAPPERSGQAPFPECVSEQSQALYAVRGALVLARKGLARATWFFYANIDQTVAAWDASGGVFSRSGLLAGNATQFQPKRAYFALQNFVGLLGAARFLYTLREDAGGFVYVLGHGAQQPTAVVAWLPTWGDSSASSVLTFSVAALGPATPSVAYTLGGTMLTSAALPAVSGTSLTLTVGAAPVVVLLL